VIRLVLVLVVHIGTTSNPHDLLPRVKILESASRTLLVRNPPKLYHKEHFESGTPDDSQSSETHPSPDTDPLVVNIPLLGPFFSSIDLIDHLVSSEIISDPVSERATLETRSSTVHCQNDNLVLANEMMMPISNEFVIDRLGRRTSVRVQKNGIFLATRSFEVWR
jgi:hypothetical protein